LARRSGFPLQVLLLPAVVVRAFRFNPLRGARGSRFRPVTGKIHKRSLFEIEALQCREMFTQFLNAFALRQQLAGFIISRIKTGKRKSKKENVRRPLFDAFLKKSFTYCNLQFIFAAIFTVLITNSSF
jgi:hypothetical protein